MLQVVCKQRAIEVARRRGLPSGHHVTVDVASRRKCARNARNEKQLSRQTYSKATHGLQVACFSLITSQIFLPAINDHRAIDVAHQHKKQVTPAQERRTSRAREGSGRVRHVHSFCVHCDASRIATNSSSTPPSPHARTSATRSVAATSQSMASVPSRAAVCSVDERERHEHTQTSECVHPYKKLRAKKKSTQGTRTEDRTERGLSHTARLL
jgi:hypothetical protein